MEHWREAERIGGARCIGTVLAVRGNRLVLRHNHFRGPRERSAFEVETVSVYELGDDGLLSRQIVFDPDDLDAAFAELDERYARGEGSTGTEAILLGERLLRAMNAGDWEGYHEVVADDVRFVDHRTASLGELTGADAYSSYARSLDELTTSHRIDIVNYVRVADSLCLGHARFRGTMLDGGTIGSDYYGISRVRGGRIGYIEIFAPEALDHAIDRFDELARQPSVVEIDNAAMRAIHAVLDRLTHADWDGFAALYAGDAIGDDRRSLLRTSIVGREAIVEASKAVLAVGADRYGVVPLAVRGDRLALARVTHSGTAQDSFEVALLVVVELDDEGRTVSYVQFDPDDQSAALNELDERYIAGEAAPYAATISVLTAMRAAFAGRDWVSFRAVVADDVVLIDHRPAGAGQLSGIDEYVAYAKTLTDVAPELTTHVSEIVAIANDRLLAVNRTPASTRDSQPFELDSLRLYVVRDGHIQRVEVFPVDDRPAALSRFQQLGPRPDAQVLENRCTRVVAEQCAHYRRGDFDAGAASYADDVVHEDRRRTLHSEIRGRDGIRGIAQTAFGVGYERFEATPVAIRDEYLALLRWRMEDRSGLESEWLNIHEIDDRGAVVRLVSFDVDDIDSAYRELSERASALAEEPSTRPASGLESAATRAVDRVVDAVSRDDTKALRAVFHPDIVQTDRRTGINNVLRGRDAALENFLVLSTAGFIARHEVQATRGERLAITWWSLTDPDSGFVVGLLGVGEIDDDGRIVRVDMFELADREGAFALLDELFIEGEGARYAEMLRLQTAMLRAWNAGDSESIVSGFAQDVTYLDHRPVSIGELHGRDALAALATTGITDDVRHEVVALHELAPDGALVRYVTRGTNAEGGVVEQTYLQYYFVDADLKVRLIERFDVSDFETARTRFLEHVGTSADGVQGAERSALSETPAVRSLHALMTAGRAEDWEAYARLHAEGVVLEDRRRGLGARFEGRAAMAEFAKASIPGVDHISVETIAARGDRLALARGTWSMRGGFEVELFSLHEVDEAGLIASIVLFDPDDRDAAIIELDRRHAEGEGDVASGTQPNDFVLENRCTRVLAEQHDHYRRGDFEAGTRMDAGDFVRFDRRRALQTEQHGRDEQLVFLRASVDVGYRRFEFPRSRYAASDSLSCDSRSRTTRGS